MTLFRWRHVKSCYGMLLIPQAIAYMVIDSYSLVSLLMFIILATLMVIGFSLMDRLQAEAFLWERHLRKE